MAGNEKMTTPMTPGIGGVEGLNKDVSVRNLMQHEETRDRSLHVADANVDISPGIARKAHEILAPFNKEEPLSALEKVKDNVKNLGTGDILSIFEQAKASATFKWGDIEASIFANMSPVELLRKRGHYSKSFPLVQHEESRYHPSDRPNRGLEHQVQQIGIAVTVPFNLRK